MKYDPLLNTPLLNALKASADLRNALYDLASVYSSDGNYEMSGKMVALRDILRQVEIEVEAVNKQNDEALLNEVTEAGLI